MFDDVDESLRSLLLQDVPLDPAEVEISFDRPTREWSGRLAGPTLNLFLFDIRERMDFRDDSWRTSRTAGGVVTRERGPRRVDLSYSVTAWTREPEDEHRILGRVLASLYRNMRLPEEHHKGALEGFESSIPLRAMPPDHLQKSTDFWGVMDNELRANLTWVVTAPLDVFAPHSGPMVRTRTLRVGRLANTETEAADEAELLSREMHHVGGIVHRGEDESEGVAGARLSIEGTGVVAVSDEHGKFSFSPLAAGSYDVRVEPPEGDPFAKKLQVPSDGYDVALPEGAGPSSPGRGSSPRHRPKK
jgi:hypothetical protein